MFRRRLLWTVLALGGAMYPSVAQADLTVRTDCNVYLPKTAAITQGETVAWENVCGIHDVIFDDGSYREPPQPLFPPWTVTRTFNTPGSFRYYCSVHGARGGVGMAGTVVVNAAASNPSGTTAPPTASPQTTTPSPTAPGTQVGAQKPRCSSRRSFRIRIRRPGGIRIRSATVSVNGKAIEVRRQTLRGRIRHTARVDLRGRPKGTYKVRIRVVTATGRALRGVRVYRTCSAQRGPHELPRL